MFATRSSCLARLILLVALALPGLGAAQQPAVEIPRVLDEQLELVLAADSSQIVQPIGVDFLPNGRLLAIESHTHFPPDNYAGLPHDRVLAMRDTTGDGRLDEVATYFEGTRHTMDIAVHTDGSVYLATRNEILRLRDEDGDGRAEQRQRIAFLDTKGSYPHNGLSGLCFDFDGNLYFGMGENLGVAYRLIGSDGTVIADEAEGGNVFWCAADGAKLRRVATGFWNPFGVCRDPFGNLFAIDNDPSANGCRLLHVIEGGNYGYHYRYGRSGLHPFIAWRGELPGTLPMICPTGEAPCELICYHGVGLPAKYRNLLMSACWSEHQIQLYRLIPSGASFRADRDVLVEGGEDFRPVGIAVAADGSLWISDWVKRDYKLHGHGRIWHLRQRVRAAEAAPADRLRWSPDRSQREAAARELVASGDVAALRQRLKSADPFVAATAIEALGAIPAGREQLRELATGAVTLADAAGGLRALAIRRLLQPPPNIEPAKSLDLSNAVMQASVPPLARLAAAGTLTAPAHADEALALLAGSDPFLRSAAITQLAAHPELLSAMPESHASAAVRAQLMLAKRRAGADPSKVLPSALEDEDADVAFMALKWIADERLSAFRPQVDAMLARPSLTTSLFLAAATAVDRLEGRAGDETQVMSRLIPKLADSDVPAASKVMILRGIPAPGEMRRAGKAEVPEATLRELLKSDDAALLREAVRFLASGASRAQAETLADLADDKTQDLELRRDAVLGVARHADALRPRLMRWWSTDSGLHREVLQALAGSPLGAGQLEQLRRSAPAGLDDIEQSLLRLSQQPVRGATLNEDIQRWREIAKQGGDAEAGRRVFLHPRLAKCSNCHQIYGRGAMVGPDLSQIRRQSDVGQVLESIIRPNKNVAPHYTAWRIVTDDGEVRTGFLVFQTEQDQTFLDDQGRQLTLKNEEIESAEPLETSIMPTGLLGLLTDQEVRDLLAYLFWEK